MCYTVAMAQSTLARKVSALLATRGWTHSHLEQLSGVSGNYIGKILRGDRMDPGFQVVASLAQGLGVSLDWLADLPPQPDVNTLSPEERILVESFRQVSDPLIRSFILDSARRSAEQARR